MQLQLVNLQTRPIFEEGSCFESISQVLSDIVNKVKEIAMAILSTILPCIFSSKPPLNPSTVAEGLQILPQVQVPIPGQIIEAPQPPRIGRQPNAVQQHQEPLAQPHEQLVEQQHQEPPAQPDEQLVEQQHQEPPAQPDEQLVEQQPEEPPAQPDEQLVEQQHQEPPAQPHEQLVEQQQPEEPLFELFGADDPELVVVPPAAQEPLADRVPRLLAQIDQIRAAAGRPPVEADDNKAEEHKGAMGPVVVPKAIIGGTQTLPIDDIDAALFVVLEAFGKQPAHARKESLDRIIVDGVKKHREHQEADFEAVLAAKGLETAVFPVPSQQRYALPHYPTLSRGFRGVLNSTYCTRISEAAFSMRMLAQGSGKSEFGVLKVDNWVYGLIVVPRGMKAEFYFLNPYADPISMCQFDTGLEFAQYFTGTIKPEQANHNFQYQLVPIKQTAAAAPAPLVEDEVDDADDNKEAVVVNITKLRPFEAVAGFYAACIAASSFQARDDFEVVDGLISDLLRQGLSVGADSADADPVGVMALGGANLVKLDAELTRSKWVQELPKLLKDNEPLGVVLTNRNFTNSFGLMLVPSEDGESIQFRLFCANTDPATFTVHDSTASLLETLKSSSTKYTAYTIGAYRRLADHLD